MKSSTRVSVIGNSFNMASGLNDWDVVSVQALNDISRLTTGWTGRRTGDMIFIILVGTWDILGFIPENRPYISAI
jgi:hypothetical protein